MQAQDTAELETGQEAPVAEGALVSPKNQIRRVDRTCSSFKILRGRMVKTTCLLLLIIGCSKAMNEENYPVTESEVLNNFIRLAPVQYINLDSLSTVHIELSEEDLIFNSENLDMNSLIGWMMYSITTDDAFYVFEKSDKNIIQINFDGQITKTVAANGRGPGEVLSVSSMAKNSSNIFVADRANARINIYNHDFKLEKTLASFMVEDISVNEEYIAYNEVTYQGIKTSGMVTIAKLSSPQDSIAKVMPKIIPDGMQPMVFNSVSFDMNNKNEIAASSDHLPWISLFDSNFLIERTLIFESSDFDNRNLVELKIHPADPNNKAGVGGAFIMDNFKYLDDGSLIINDNDGIIYLRRNKDRSYEAVAKYVVDYPRSEKSFWVGSLDVSDLENIKASNWYYLFQFKLPE
jgi:hypothetical protein